MALPIDTALPELLKALDAGNSAILTAPPGAGKTTRVPLALLDAPWCTGRIMMLEPRRIAARAAAERMASSLGEAVGQTVGYRIRGDRAVGRDTRIEVVTEGILTRILQRDAELPGVSAILFDEIHERSIHSDLGLALTRDVQDALRPDLRILAMSATLDAAGLLRTLPDAAMVQSEGRMFPVETRWAERPWRRQNGPRDALTPAVVDMIDRARAETTGGILVFLPGAAEIHRVAARLDTGPDAVHLLFGALRFDRQRAALAPDPEGRRKIVLATSLAETSLTVADVRVVVDAGLARRPRVDPATGMGQLVTVPVSRAEAEQRRGRAGRVAPGVCYRLWTRGEDGALPAQPPPEITEADLAPLALELAEWGAEPEALAFIDPPPPPRLAEARNLLKRLRALDDEGRITPHGRQMTALPLHPRLAHLCLAGAEVGEAEAAAMIAAAVSERDPAQGTARRGVDLAGRLERIGDPRTTDSDAGAAHRVRDEARRLGARKWDTRRATRMAGALAAEAWPDRIALRRPGDAPRFLLANGRGAVLDPSDPLANQRLLVAIDLEDGREARIRLAAPLDEATLRKAHGDAIAWTKRAVWDRRRRRVEAREQEMYGALVLDDRHWGDAPPEALAEALATGIAELGIAFLPWSAAATRLRGRVRWLAGTDAAWQKRLPDWSDAGLTETLDAWLTPYLSGMRRIEEIGTLDLVAILRGGLDHALLSEIDRAAPAGFTTPTGRTVSIDYGADVPKIALPLGEMYGTTHHPTAGSPPVPLLVELLSPAGRAVQTTRDIPGFWASSYNDVRKDMRARYPKHDWPEDPANAAPASRSRRRRA